MARPLEMEYPGVHYHVLSRGNQRRPIVRDDGSKDVAATLGYASAGGAGQAIGCVEAAFAHWRDSTRLGKTVTNG